MTGLVAFWGEGAASALARLVVGATGARWVGRHGGVVLSGAGARLRSARAQAAGVALVGTSRGAGGELLAHLGSHGPAALAGAEGSFLALGWSGERAWVQGDPWASRRLFARELPGGVALATDLGPLVALGGPAALDPAQAITFLLTGRFFAGGCLGAGLRLLRPGERWHLVRGSLQVEPLPPPWWPAEVDAAEAAARLPAAIERAVEEAWTAAPAPLLLLSRRARARTISPSSATAAAALAGAFPAVAAPWLAAYAARVEARLAGLPSEPLALREALYAAEPSRRSSTP
jgi:hypothetical protein